VYGTNVPEKLATSVFKEEVSSNLKMKAVDVSKMLTAIYQTTRHIILEKGNSVTNRCKNLKSHSSVCLYFETSRRISTKFGVCVYITYVRQNLILIYARPILRE